MRMLMHVIPAVEKFNEAIRKGSAGTTMNKILETIKPEATYFTEASGRRSVLMIVDLADPSKIPALAEPWYLAFNAEVRFQVVMMPQDLQRAGLDDLGKKWG
jgi:hypothetical protein